MENVWNDLAKPDMSLIRSWSAGLQRTMPFPAPYLSIHDIGPKQLLFLASRHGPGEGSPTLKTVRHVIDNFGPDLVVLEGIPNEGQRSPKSFISDHELSEPSSFVTSSEQAYAAYLARKKGIDFVSGERTPAETLSDARAAGCSDRDFLFLATTSCLKSMLRSKRLDGEENSLRLASDRLLKSQARRYDIEAQTPEELAQWFSSTCDTPLSSDSLRTLDDSPRNDAGASPFQKMNWAIDEPRESGIVRNVWAALQEQSRVLVVFGSAHQPKQQKVYDALAGAKARHYKFF
jgi:hypothetical protein